MFEQFRLPLGSQFQLGQSVLSGLGKHGRGIFLLFLKNALFLRQNQIIIIDDTAGHASHTYKSTVAVTYLTEVLENAEYVSTVLYYGNRIKEKTANNPRNPAIVFNR